MLDIPRDNQFKRVFIDIETSQALGKLWRSGWRLSVMADRIMIDAAIICVSWKWEGIDKIHKLPWDANGCDKEMLIKFVKILDVADEIVAHNGDKFDLPWVTGRCVVHQIPALPDYKTVDTLKMARKHKFDSCKLDALAKRFGIGSKIKHRGIIMWDEIEDGTRHWATPEEQKLGKKALKEMLDYCDHDVIILEGVYNRLIQYGKPKTHMGVWLGGDKWECPYCGSDDVVKGGGDTVTKAGTKKKRMRCKACAKNPDKKFATYQINMKAWADYWEAKNRKGNAPQ